ncbi:hypothetical protein T439DRAFT_329459 [Meredithblackwellia eburnea MCA 4105]
MLPGPGAQLTPAQIAAIRSRQQQPNVSGFVFLSIMFFLLSNNGPDDPAAESAPLSRLLRNLHRREMRRDGLAVWLGVNTSYVNNTASNATSLFGKTALPTNNSTLIPLNESVPIPFEPHSNANPNLISLMHGLLDPPETQRPLHYSQNLTGLGKGRWNLQKEWDWNKLGIPEAYNRTKLVEKPLDEKEEEEAKKKKAEESSRAGGNGEQKSGVRIAEEGGEQSPEPPADPHGRLGRRDEGDTKPGLERIGPEGRVMVNVTETVNRTVARGDFPWAKGGKITFQLAEDQTSAVGPVLLPGDEQRGRGRKERLQQEDDGRLLELKKGPLQKWEEQGPVTYLRGDVTIYTHDGSENIVLDVEGVHLLSQGTFFAYASPQTVTTTYAYEVPGLPLYDLEHHPNANYTAQAAGRAILREVDRRIARDRAELDNVASSGSSTVSSGGGISPFSDPEPECTFTFYGRLSPLPASYSLSLYREYYSSLFHPTGSSLAPPPKPVIKYLLYSEPCGMVLEGETDMTPIPEAWSRATNLSTMLGIMQGLLLFLLVRQMEARGSPNSLSKLAHATIGMQAAMDAYTFIATFTVSVAYNSRASFPTLVPCFFALVGSLIFGMRHASDIRSSYPPPPPAPVLPPPPTTGQLAATAAEQRAAGSVPSAPPAVVVTPPDGDNFAMITMISAVVAALVIIFVWGWIALLIIIFFSYWIPQIVMNVQRGAARMTLRKEYIVGTTVARLFLPVYFLACPNNLLGVDPSPWVVALILYSTFQAAILLLQDSRLGARFFVPKILLARIGVKTEEIWDYHPLLDMESGRSLEDCPICMEEIDVGDKEEREALHSNPNAPGKARWGYMVPPCNHACHTHCLESWMQIKNVCPVCRRRLPPI